jgi:putative sporulation protein YyaC
MIIVIDSSLGIRQDIGKDFVTSGGLDPGLGVGKNFTSIGDYSIKGIVNVRGPLIHQVLQSTRLSLVIKIAEEIAQSLACRFPLANNHRFLADQKIKVTV